MTLELYRSLPAVSSRVARFSRLFCYLLIVLALSECVQKKIKEADEAFTQKKGCFAVDKFTFSENTCKLLIKNLLKCNEI